MFTLIQTIKQTKRTCLGNIETKVEPPNRSGLNQILFRGARYKPGHNRPHRSITATPEGTGLPTNARQFGIMSWIMPNVFQGMAAATIVIIASLQ